ncbi:hypothetical protein QE399_003216 [Paracidovorax wautersii]|uniref:YqjK-like protein n=2 Tax=Paracidovorax wautersii TaxID=1177982 RepID=A0ABU1IE79_9BURK|nr:hypothetical protein [Paracidovorax wautersii]
MSSMRPPLERDSGLPTPTEPQQKVLDRIALQRERLRARRAAHRQAVALQAEDAGIDPQAPLVARVLAFARLHPAVVAVAALGALAAGPSRLIRWSSVLMPLLARMRR